MISNAASMSAAEQDWNRARRKELYQEVVCLFKACSVDLLSFEEATSGMDLDQSIDRGLQEIPLDRIRGSVGRYDDFSSAFLPRKAHMRERWEQVAVAMKTGRTPPIKVYQVEDAFFVVDGNHRVSIARENGWETIKAHVTEYLSGPEAGPDEDINELLLRKERAAFLEKVGPDGLKEVREIVFTCPHRYGDLLDMLDTYRAGLETEHAAPVSFAEATRRWQKEVYQPAIQTIRDNDQLSRFPSRSEADLFIWSWKNHKALEELVFDEEGEEPG
jgi:hypothetical protein